MQVKYVGPYDEAEVPALGLVVKNGETVDVSDADAEALLEQDSNWQPATKKKGA